MYFEAWKREKEKGVRSPYFDFVVGIVFRGRPLGRIVDSSFIRLATDSGHVSSLRAIVRVVSNRMRTRAPKIFSKARECPSR